jgi:tRNA modification GTPase
LIESRSRQSARISLRQLQGRLSEDFSKIEDELVWVLAHLEASIDFSTEDIEVVQSAELESKLGDLIDLAAKLIGSYRQGRLLKEGIEVALVGLPNAGKSSLLNAFTGESRAIVTPHAGTTRDTIESRVSIAGVPVTFVDTAGLRTSEDEVERLGIERSRVAMAKADFVFYVIDGSVPIKVDEALPFWSESKDRAYVLMNKVDLLKRVDWNDVISFGVHPERVFSVSALTRQGFDQVERLLGKVGADLDIESSNVVTQARHLELLQKIHSCLGNALRLIKDASSPEFVAFELRDAIRAIHELLGKVFDEQVIDRIFKEFCLGK